jgi:hypothetical protein
VSVVGEMLGKFWEQVEQCSCLEDSSSRVYDLVLRLADNQAQPTVHVEEAAG